MDSVIQVYNQDTSRKIRKKLLTVSDIIEDDSGIQNGHMDKRERIKE